MHRDRRHNESTYILRQSKCVDFEAPFLYLLLGSEKALLLDTGSGGDPPVDQEVYKIVERWRGQHLYSEFELIVAHTHSHGDHIQGDPMSLRI